MSKSGETVAATLAATRAKTRAATTAAASASGSATVVTAAAAAAAPDALLAQLPALAAAARAVRTRAHAPYSRFAVGAAVLDEQGRIHAGCNVENAAYPQGWCAETSAIAAMVAAGGRQVLAAVVCAVAASPAPPVTPCGGCRQRLREFAADDCVIWSVDDTDLLATYRLGQLLPFSFGPGHLSSP